MIGRRLIKKYNQLTETDSQLLEMYYDGMEQVDIFVKIEIEIIEKYLSKDGCTKYIYKELSFVDDKEGVIVCGKIRRFLESIPLIKLKDKLKLDDGLCVMSGDELVRTCVLKEETK